MGGPGKVLCLKLKYLKNLFLYKTNIKEESCTQLSFFERCNGITLSGVRKKKTKNARFPIQTDKFHIDKFALEQYNKDSGKSLLSKEEEGYEKAL